MFSVALFGASAREESLALKLQIRLQKEGIQIFPINPRYPEINGTACYPSFEEVYKEGQRVDLFVFMTNPQLTLDLLSNNLKFGVKKVWFQPGTFDDEVLEFCRENGLDFNTEHCMIIAPLSIVEEFLKR
ncbi:CoA-binding protein [Candidatus Gracilibacteria bacterium]|nr:MAG: CoA-binding protein [Candidatus Gracilibacteria bacterium]